MRLGQSSQPSWSSDAKVASILCDVALLRFQWLSGESDTAGLGTNALPCTMQLETGDRRSALGF